MTPVPGPHLSPDDIDAWLAGTLAPAGRHHLGHCPECLERAQAEQEIVALLSALPPLSPAPDFADRVMQSVAVPDPFAIRSLQAVRHRLFATRKAAVLAASLALLLAGSMAASIVWTLGHQQTLAAMGEWLASQAGQAAWLAVRGVASNFIEQPWYLGAKALLTQPARVALASALASLAYLVGVVALRRLLALPTQHVVHAQG